MTKLLYAQEFFARFGSLSTENSGNCKNILLTSFMGIQLLAPAYTLAMYHLPRAPLWGYFRDTCKGALRSAGMKFVSFTDSKSTKAVGDAKVAARVSRRMKEFHEKLELQPVPSVAQGMRFVDLVLVEVDPISGELRSNAEKDPTKWGDWQVGGRMKDDVSCYYRGIKGRARGCSIQCTYEIN